MKSFDWTTIAAPAAAKGLNTTTRSPVGALVLALRAAAPALLAAITAMPAAVAQMRTDLPPAVPGAKPVTVEHVKIHSAAIATEM